MADLILSSKADFVKTPDAKRMSEFFITTK
jgi:hypothetical protein